MRIGPDDADERLSIEIENLDRVEEYIRWLKQTLPGFRLTEAILLKLHGLVVEGLYDCAGQYRSTLHQVEVTSDTFEPASAADVRLSIPDLLDRYNRAQPKDNWERHLLATDFFHEFLVIHPFAGGNGRVARALLALILYQQNLIPSRIDFLTINYTLEQRRDVYLPCLQAADRGNKSQLASLIHRATQEAYIEFFAQALRRWDRISELTPGSQRLVDAEFRVELSDDELSRGMDEFLPQFEHILDEIAPESSPATQRDLGPDNG